MYLKGKHHLNRDDEEKNNISNKKEKSDRLWIQCLLIFLLFFIAAMGLFEVDKRCSKTLDSEDSFYLKKVEIWEELH